MQNDYILRSEHNEFMKRMEDEHKRINHRLSKAEEIVEQIHEINKNIGTLASNMEYLLKEQLDHSKRLHKIENEPKTAWNSIKKGLFNSLGAAIGGAIIAALLFFI